jgi:3-dehydroquinate dehydratase / shikimate dehydrogenase
MRQPLLCVTVSAADTGGLRRRRDEIVDADLVELRLDSVADPNVAAAIAGRRRPVIVTCRPRWEGGAFNGSEEARRRILAEALELGAEYVDIEMRAGFDDLVAREGGRRIVLSHHDFAGMPSDLTGLVQAMRATGAGVTKIAVRTASLSDCVSLRDLGSRLRPGADLVLIGMGDFGIATRVLAGRFGSRWTYAGPIGAVGQLSADAMLRGYRFRRLGETTDVYGVVGLPVTHSVSPAMHNAAFDATRLDAVYLPLPAVSADDFVRFGKAFGVKGASITIPHKIAMFDRVDEVDAVARRVGAINTVCTNGDRWIGGNTDVEGFLQPLTRRQTLAGLRASVLGSGGAARAVSVALTATGCAVRLHARNRQRAEATAAVTGAGVGETVPERGSWDLLVNCTPVGMYPHVNETPIDGSLLTGRIVYDLVYNPVETRLLRDAARAGCQTIDGLEMLVAQAQEQFQRWTGVRPPADVMRDAALARLAEFKRDEDYVV